MGRKKVEINKIRGDNLRILLNEKGMGQKELAEKIGYTHCGMCRLHGGISTRPCRMD